MSNISPVNEGEEEFVLDNGLTIMLSENNESPNIFGVIGVKAGGKNDPKDATGIAHYLEHLLFKGTEELGTIDYTREKVYLDSIEVKYDELGLTTDENERIKISWILMPRLVGDEVPGWANKDKKPTCVKMPARSESSLNS